MVANKREKLARWWPFTCSFLKFLPWQIAFHWEGWLFAPAEPTPMVMVAHLPTHGTRTLYARIGDLFAWICAASLAGIIIWRLI